MASNSVVSLDPPIPTAAEVQEKTDKLLQETPAEEAAEKRPGREHVFTIKKFSRMYDKVLEGDFETQILTPRQELQVGSIRSRLLGSAYSMSVDTSTTFMAEKIAHLEVSLTKKPSWFNALDFEDKEILDDIYTEVASHEARFWGRESALE